MIFPALAFSLANIFAGAAEPEIRLSPQDVETHMAEHLMDVAPFDFIRKEAEKLGVRVYLLGGTAAGYAAYATDDLKRKRGDSRYQADRFDYDYSSIYRSTQDADIAIDGTAEQAVALENILKAHQSFLLGYKTKWEVRTLHHRRDNKAPLRGDFQFDHQHTDSASVVLIELTKPPHGEPVIRDLRHWNSQPSPFVRALADGRIDFYYSDRHEETDMAKDKLNPPIIAAIRFLAKASQYRWKVSDADKQLLKDKIVANFDPAGSLKTAYARKRLIEFGMKCFQNSSDVLYAWKLLEEMGLREKLIKLGDEDLSYWLDREPLPANDVGKGDGDTAKTLRITEVAHTTRNFRHYEAITSSPFGIPNVFASRRGVSQEGAAHGDGFYTRKGHKGAWDTGLTIRFRVRPEARQGTDFDLIGDYVVFKNRNAFEVIPESIRLAPIEFLRLLVEQRWDESDLGLLLRFKRRVSAQSKVESLTVAEEEQAKELLGKLLKMEKKGAFKYFVEKDLLPSEIVKSIPALRPAFSHAWSQYALEAEVQADLVLLAQIAMNIGASEEVLFDLVNKSTALVLKNLLRSGFSKPESFEMRGLLKKIIDHPFANEDVWLEVVQSALTQSFHADKIDLLVDILSKHWSKAVAMKAVELILPLAKAEPYANRLLPVLISKGDSDVNLALVRLYFPQEISKEHLDQLKPLITSSSPDVKRAVAKFVLVKPHASERDDLLKLLFDQGETLTNMILKRDCRHQLIRIGKWL